MAVTKTTMPRVFVNGGTEYPDPAPGLNANRALEVLAVSNASFNNAALEGPKYEGGKEIWKIKIQVGEKG